MSFQVFRYMVVVMFSLLHASSVVNCITLGDKEHEILSNLLDEFRSHPAHPRYNCVIYSGMKKIPKVFIWCPKQHLNIDIFCPSAQNSTGLSLLDIECESRQFSSTKIGVRPSWKHCFRSSNLPMSNRRRFVFAS